MSIWGLLSSTGWLRDPAFLRLVPLLPQGAAQSFLLHSLLKAVHYVQDEMWRTRWHILGDKLGSEVRHFCPCPFAPPRCREAGNAVDLRDQEAEGGLAHCAGSQSPSPTYTFPRQRVTSWGASSPARPKAVGPPMVRMRAFWMHSIRFTCTSTTDP